MGTYLFRTITVVCWNAEDCKAARAKAKELKLKLTRTLYTARNGWHTFHVEINGSKFTWPTYVSFHSACDAFVKYLRGTVNHWVDVNFSHDHTELHYVDRSSDWRRG